ncbi:ENR1 protein, partial [Nycticryphes semicollaris]|nr:ENR1 protein [Nycticryphes semicollaris]
SDNQTQCWKNQTNANPFEEIEDLGSFWRNPEKTNSSWKSPDGLFWICGKRAYNELPKKWRGSCTIGIIQPAFFLLPKIKGNQLGIPL